MEEHTWQGKPRRVTQDVAVMRGICMEEHAWQVTLPHETGHVLHIRGNGGPKVWHHPRAVLTHRGIEVNIFNSIYLTLQNIRRHDSSAGCGTIHAPYCPSRYASSPGLLSSRPQGGSASASIGQRGSVWVSVGPRGPAWVSTGQHGSAAWGSVGQRGSARVSISTVNMRQHRQRLEVRHVPVVVAAPAWVALRVELWPAHVHPRDRILRNQQPATSWSLKTFCMLDWKSLFHPAPSGAGYT